MQYCRDAGIVSYDLVAQRIIAYETATVVYPDNKILSKARLAWSLIKCGIYYKNGLFHYTMGTATFVADLEMMLELVLGHLTDTI